MRLRPSVFELTWSCVRASRARLDAFHEYMVPGVHCPACDQKWASWGIAYPCVELGGYERASELTATNRPLAEVEQLIEEVRRFLPPGAALGPGTRFGTVIGRAAAAEPCRFEWNVGQLFIRADVLALLRGRTGWALPARECRLERRKPVAHELFVLDFPAVAHLDRQRLPPTMCPRCGLGERRPWTQDMLAIERDTVPETPLFRPVEWPTKLLCREEFVLQCDALGIDELAFAEVEVV